MGPKMLNGWRGRREVGLVRYHRSRSLLNLNNIDDTHGVSTPPHVRVTWRSNSQCLLRSVSSTLDGFSSVDVYSVKLDPFVGMFHVSSVCSTSVMWGKSLGLQPGVASRQPLQTIRGSVPRVVSIWLGRTPPLQASVDDVGTRWPGVIFDLLPLRVRSVLRRCLTH